MKFIVHFYNNIIPFSGGIDEDWLRHFDQFEMLSKDYESDDVTLQKQFVHTLKPGNKAN